MSNVSLVNGHIDRPKMTDEQIIKALECCTNNDDCGAGCPCFSEKQNMCGEYNGLLKQSLDLINRQKSDIERLSKRIAGQKHSLFEQQSYTAKLQNELRTIKSEAIKEFADKITEIFVRYAHLHNYADKARTETIESAEGYEIEMQSVWDVLSLKKYEMAEYEEMSELQKKKKKKKH